MIDGAMTGIHGRRTFAWYWVTVVGGTLAASVLAFLVLTLLVMRQFFSPHILLPVTGGVAVLSFCGMLVVSRKLVRRSAVEEDRALRWIGCSVVAMGILGVAATHFALRSQVPAELLSRVVRAEASGLFLVMMPAVLSYLRSLARHNRHNRGQPLR